MSKLYAFLATVGFMMITLAINAQPTFYFSPSNQTPGLGDQITVDVLVDDFTDITSYQYSVNWNTSHLSYVSIGNFNPELGLAMGNFGTTMTGSGKLSTLWSDPLANPQTLTAGAVLFTITFDVVAGSPVSTDIQFTGNPTGMEVTQDTGGGIMEITNQVIFIDTTIDIAGGGSGGGGGLTCNFSGFGILVESDSAGTGEQVCLDVSVCNFTDIVSMQYTMQFNPAILQFDEIQNINLQDLSTGNFGTTMANNGFVTLSWNDPMAQGVTVPNETVIYSLCFTAIGAGGSVDSVLINGSLASIEVIDVNSGGNNIGLESIDGEVKITGDSGSLPTVIAACETGNPGDTVYVDVTVENFTDMLSLQYSMGWDPNIIDFYEIQETNALPGGLNFNTSQALVDSGKLTFLWSDPQVTGVTLADNTVIYRVGYIIVGNGGQSSNVSFTDDPVAIEASQNNGGNSEIIPLGTETGCVDVEDEIDPGLFGLVLSDESACPGDTIEVEVTVQNFIDIVSMQYDIQFDNNHLEYVDAINVNLSGGPLFNQNTANTVRIVWTEPTVTPQTLANGTVIYIMRFVLLGGSGSSSDITFVPHNPPSVFVEISKEPGGVIDDYNLTGSTITASCGNPLTTSALVTNILCPGDLTGAIDLTVNGGSGNYTFMWSPGGSTNQNISNLSAGTYTVTISDGVDQIVETFSIIDVTISSTSSMVSCNSLCDGAIDLSIPGFIGNFTFNWSNGLPSQEDQTGLCAGTYFVTITGQNGCTKIEGPIPVTQPSELTVTGVVTNETGMNMDGAIDLTVSGGTPNYQFNWSNAAVTEDISGLSQGNYTVTVTDNNGCTVVETFLVDGSMAVESNVVDVSCFGNNDGEIHLSVAGGVSPYSYQWLGSPSTSPDRVGLFAGSYSVTVTDANGVMIVSSIQVNQPDAITILQADITNETGNGCNGSIDITVTGGTLPYSYQWNNGATWPDISNLCKGNYDVTIVDANGCVFISSVYTVAAPPLIVANSSKTDVTCNGGDDGSVCITVLGGCGPWKFSIPALNNDVITNANPGEEVCIDNLPAGSHNVVIQDSGTPISAIIHTVEIVEPDPIIVGVNAVFNNTTPTCDNPNGAIDISVSGGTPGYTYLWNNGSTLQDPTGLCHLAPLNPYTVTVTDVNGCTHESEAIDINDGLFIAIDELHHVCEDCDGSVSITVIGGEPPYMYDWGGADPNSLCAGSYSVTVTDNAGNTVEMQNITINEPSSVLTITANNIEYPTNGMNNGSIDVTVSGGYGQNTYLWSNGSTTPDIGGLAAGNYSLTVTDLNGCQAFFNQNLSDEGLILDFTIEAPVCYGDSNGLIEVFVTGGSGNYSYEWFPDVGNQSPLAFGLGSGNYSVTVTDLGNPSLTATQTIPLGDPDPLVINILSTPSTGGATGSLEADVEGGTEPFKYLWNDDENQSTQVAENLPSGEYAVRVEDANGCVEIAQGAVELGGECFTYKEVLSFNGNGKNTELIIRCSEKFDNTLQIFNRWGQLVYNTTNYDNTWSGIDNDGNDVSAGGYYFVFEYEDAGTSNRVRGSITILR